MKIDNIYTNTIMDSKDILRIIRGHSFVHDLDKITISNTTFINLDKSELLQRLDFPGWSFSFKNDDLIARKTQSLPKFCYKCGAPVFYNDNIWYCASTHTGRINFSSEYVVTDFD